MQLDRDRTRCYHRVTMPSSARKSAPTTSIKIPESMKKAVTRLAAEAGMTPHGYLLSLIREGVDRNSKRQQFIAEARKEIAQFKRDGLAIPADDVHRYLDEKAAGKNLPRPKPVKWRK